MIQNGEGKLENRFMLLVACMFVCRLSVLYVGCVAPG